MPTKAQRPKSKTTARLAPSKPHVVASKAKPAKAVAIRIPVKSQVKTIVLAGALLAVATLAIYYRATQNPFVNYDDTGYVTENTHIQQGITPAMLRWSLTATEASNWHPLTWISHALDCQMYGLNPAGHHLSSVILHVFNVLLVFLLLARVTGAPWRSLIVAGLFALHPINVESVAWIAERKNVLSMFFLLLAMGAYGWYARRPGVGRYLLVAGLFALGLAAKPMVVTLPFLLLLVDFWPLYRVRGQKSSAIFEVPQSSFWRLVLEKLPLLVLSGASCVITMIAQQGAIATNQGLPFTIRAMNAVYAYTMYVVKGFWPARLASFYPYEGLRISVWQVSLCSAFLIAVSIWVWRERARVYLPVGWFWFLGTLVPVIGLVQVGDQAMADRYAYLPLIGVFVMVAWGVADLLQTRRVNVRWCAVSAAVILCALSFLTWRQIGVWNSSYDLWSHALQVTKDNYMAEDYVGTSLLVKTFESTGQRRSDEATVHFRNAARINPKDAISHLNLGADFHERGRLQEAIQEYQTVLGLTLDPHLLLKAFSDLGAAYHQFGNYPTSRQCYQEALKLDPQNQVVFMGLGKLSMDERIQTLAEDAAAHPSPAAYLQLGLLQQAAGHPADARASYESALKIDAKYSEARKALTVLEKTTQH